MSRKAEPQLGPRCASAAPKHVSTRPSEPTVKSMTGGPALAYAREEASPPRDARYRSGRRLSHKPVRKPAHFLAVGQQCSATRDWPSSWDDGVVHAQFRLLRPTVRAAASPEAFERQPRRPAVAPSPRRGARALREEGQ